MNKTFITWMQYQEDVLSLAKKMSSRIQVQNVVGIPRGGIVLAVSLSYLLNVPFKTEIDGVMQENRILLVDDLVDSGTTMNEWTNRYPLVHTATLYRKDCTNFEPEFVARTINDWIVFPYETEETSRRDYELRTVL